MTNPTFTKNSKASLPGSFDRKQLGIIPAVLFGGVSFLIASGHPVQATSHQGVLPNLKLGVMLGGLNLTAWCQKQYGNGFKAKVIAKNAGGWTCERGANDRRPVQMFSACKFQYGNKAYIAKPLNGNDPNSWKCYGKPLAPTMAGVNFDPWCKKKFGNAYKARLVGSGARGWTCERLIVDRRPINVKGACILQYGQRVLQAKFLNVNDPNSWRCVLR